MNPLNIPQAAPRASFETWTALTPEMLKERVRSLTKEELERLIARMDATREVPEIFRSAETRALIDTRLTELVGMTDDTRAKWQILKAKIEGKTDVLKAKAEKGIMEELLAKGGAGAVLAGIAVAVLAFFGVKWAKNIKEKGIIESAKEHPVFAAFLAALGVSAGTATFTYFMDNKEGMISFITNEAVKLGADPIGVAETTGEKIKGVIQNIGTETVDGLVNAVAWATGGTVDPETGVVTLPYATLRPPVIVAYQAGVRRRGGPQIVQSLFSTFAVERTLDAIIRTADRAVHLSNEQRMNADKARRARLLLKEQLKGGILNTSKQLELEWLLENLAPELKMSPDAAKKLGIPTSNVEAKKTVASLKDMEKRLEIAYETEMENYRQKRAMLTSVLQEADENIRKGTIPKGKSAVEYKQEVLGKLKREVGDYEMELTKNKVQIAVDLKDTFDHHAKHHLDTQVGGELEAIGKKCERFGTYLTRSSIGKYAVRGVVGYSFLPILMEGATAFAHGDTKEGQAAAKAFKNDVLEAGGGFIPVVGEALDFKAAFTGKDLNGRELSTENRVLMGTMGVLGTASIGLGFFTGGLSIVAFRGIRGALAGRRIWKVTRTVKGAVGAADSAEDIMKAVKAGEKATDTVKSLSTVTDAQKSAAKARSRVHSAQRGMQLYTYSHLGIQVAAGAVDLLQTGAEKVEQGKQKAIQGVEAVEKFIGA